MWSEEQEMRILSEEKIYSKTEMENVSLVRHHKYNRPDEERL